MSALSKIEQAEIDKNVKLFRPLLKDLQLQTISCIGYRCVLTSEYRLFNRFNMANCAVIVSQYSFSNMEYKGVFIWQYDQEEDFYVLYIILNRNLYGSNTLDERIIRKAVSVHEFTHCVAALLTISRLKTSALIISLQKKMAQSFHALRTSDITNIFKDLAMSLNDRKAMQTENFDDSHFRTGGEVFSASYSDLYRHLLLSYDLFCEKDFFNSDIREKFYACIRGDDITGSTNILIAIIQKLVEKKSLDKKFVVQQVTTFFLPRMEEGMSF